MTVGCDNNFHPTYKEENIPFLVKQICKDEYKLDVTTQRTQTTLWIYAPVDKLLHKDYGIKEDKVYDDNTAEKLRNILTTIGRVLISSDNTPEFFALLASDTNLGIDYTIIGNVLDIKKSYSGFIPWTEANRRYIMKFAAAPTAIGDKNGEHLSVYDVTLPDFLAEQIAQRISSHFQEDDYKNYFKVDKSNGKFSQNNFIFEYEIKQTAQPPKPIDIKKEAINIITYCIQTYEFRDFSGITVFDLLKKDQLELNRKAIWDRPKD